MGVRQRKRLLRRRREAQARTRTSRTVVTGGLVTTMAGALATGAALPAQAAEVGPVEVVDLAPGVGHSAPTNLVAVGGTLFFTADDGVNGSKLWASDGTAAGTRRLTSAPPNTDPDTTAMASGLQAVGRTAVFQSTTEREGYGDLWISDGTAQGTTKVLEDVYDTTVVGDTLVVTSYDDDYDQQLHVLDGNTGQVTGLSDLEGPSVRGVWGVAGGDVIVTRRSEDGSANEVWGVSPTAAEKLLSVPRRLVEDEYDYYDGDYYYTGSLSRVGTTGERVFFTDGESLFSTDGTVAGSTEFGDFADAEPVNHYEDYDTSTIGGLGSGLFFVAEAPDDSREIFWTDGTTAGTVAVTDFDGDVSVAGWRTRFAALGDNLVMSGAERRQDDEDSYYGYQTENKLWLLQPRAGGATELGTTETRVQELATVGSKVFATTAWDELWVTDLTPAGTRRLLHPETSPVSDLDVVTDVNGTAYFTGRTEAAGRELWHSDGTTAGTRLVADVRPGPASSNPRHVTALGSKVFYQARGVNGRELWTIGPKVAPPAADTSVDGVKVSAAAKQKQGKQVRITVKAGAAEAVTTSASGSIKIKGRKGTVPLTGLTVSSAANGTATLKLSVPKAQKKTVLAAVKKARKNKKAWVRATVTLVVADKAGNRVSRSVKVRLV